MLLEQNSCTINIHFAFFWLHTYTKDHHQNNNINTAFLCIHIIIVIACKKDQPCRIIIPLPHQGRAATNLCFLKLYPWTEVLIGQTPGYHTVTTNPSIGSLFSPNLSHDKLTSIASIKLVQNGQSNCTITPTSLLFLFFDM